MAIERTCDVCGRNQDVTPVGEWLGELAPGYLDLQEACDRCQRAVEQNIVSTLVVLARGRAKA